MNDIVLELEKLKTTTGKDIFPMSKERTQMIEMLPGGMRPFGLDLRKECKLDNGYIEKYDICDSASKILGSPAKLDMVGFTYLGTGVIHSINNNVQNLKEKYHFWKVTYKC